MFAPRPDSEDYCVLYRDRLAGGYFTPWTEIYRIPNRRWFHLFWNPDKHIRKLLSHVIRGFAIELEESGMNPPSPESRLNPMSGPYLATLHAVSNAPRLGAEATQFLILRHDAQAATEPVPFFTSLLHRL
jgi:hypothetical protein